MASDRTDARWCWPHRETIERMASKYPGLVWEDGVKWAACIKCGCAGPMAPGERPHCLKHCDPVFELGDGDPSTYAAAFPPALNDACWASFRLGRTEAVCAVIEQVWWSVLKQQWEV